MTTELQMFMDDVDQGSQLRSPPEELFPLSPKHNSPPPVGRMGRERYRNDSGYVGSSSGSPTSHKLDNNLDRPSSWRPIHNQVFDEIFPSTTDWQQYADESTSPTDLPYSRRPRSTTNWEGKKPFPIMDGRSSQDDSNLPNTGGGWEHDDPNEDHDLTQNACDQLITRGLFSQPQHSYSFSPSLARKSRPGAPPYTPQPTELLSRSRSPKTFQYEHNRSDAFGDIEQQGPQLGSPADETAGLSTMEDTNSIRKISRKRRGDEETDEDDDTQKVKRGRDLERNRLAASKCRAKKKEEVRQIEEKARRLQAENAHLRAWVGQLQGEKLHLMDQILLLSDSSDARIRSFLHQRAYNLVHSRQSMPQGSLDQSITYNAGEGGLPVTSNFNVPTTPAHSRNSPEGSTQYFSRGSCQPDMQQSPRQTVDRGFSSLSLNSPTHTRGHSMGNINTTEQSPTSAIFGVSQVGPHSPNLSCPSASSAGNNEMHSLFRQSQHPAQHLTQFNPQYTWLSGLPEVAQSDDAYAEALVNRLQDAMRGKEYD